MGVVFSEGATPKGRHEQVTEYWSLGLNFGGMSFGGIDFTIKKN